MSNPKLPAWFLDTLRENALAASNDRAQGDRWNMNHGYVVSRDHTICHPTYQDKGEFGALDGYPAARSIDSNKFARHIAGVSPSVTVKLIDEITALRERIDTLGADHSQALRREEEKGYARGLRVALAEQLTAYQRPEGS